MIPKFRGRSTYADENKGEWVYGNLIFDGNRAVIVKWSQGRFTVTNRDSVEMEDLLDGELLDVTIIGNIYENSALMGLDDD